MDFSHALLVNVDMRGADVRGVNFSNALFRGVRAYGWRGTPAQVEGAAYELTDVSRNGDGSQVTGAAPWVARVSLDLRFADAVLPECGRPFSKVPTMPSSV